MKTPTPSTDDPAQLDLLPKYHERVEKLSQENCVIKICTNAGFLTTVDVEQHFMTQDTEELPQYTESVAFSWTLCQRWRVSDPQGWIRGNTKIEPVLEVTISCLHGIDVVGIRIVFLKNDNSHSWVAISRHGDGVCWRVFLHRFWAQRQFHHRGLCRVHSGFRDRATVP